jgi:pectin methylesterase-like acyl-CoA thioesterase
MAQVIDRAEIAADSIGLDMVAYIRESISTPVEYHGDVVIRSDPGDPPRMETGHLWRSQRHDVVTHGMVVHLDVINDAHYAWRLNDGDLFRPFHELAAAVWTPLLPDRMAQLL